MDKFVTRDELEMILRGLKKELEAKLDSQKNISLKGDIKILGNLTIDKLSFLGEIKVMTNGTGTLIIKNWFGPKISSVVKVSNTEITVNYSEAVVGEIILAFSRYGDKNVRTSDNMSASHTSINIEFDSLGNWGQLRMVLFSLGV